MIWLYHIFNDDSFISLNIYSYLHTTDSQSGGGDIEGPGELSVFCQSLLHQNMTIASQPPRPLIVSCSRRVFFSLGACDVGQAGTHNEEIMTHQQVRQTDGEVRVLPQSVGRDGGVASHLPADEDTDRPQ